MKILGISAFYHDSASALIDDGKIIAAAQEERFSRKKHDSDFPAQAIAFCLKQARTKFEDLDHVTFYDKPFLKFERLLETYLAFAPRGFSSFAMSVPIWLKEKLFQKSLLQKKLATLAPDVDWESKLLFAEHHQSHAASAFFPSPFDNAAILTMDGVGEWATTSVFEGDGNNLAVSREIHFPHSLGLLYSAFTYYIGFRVNSGEYKVMGLAPYGTATYKDKILENLIDLKSDGTFRLNMEFFDYCTGLCMTNDKFNQLFGAPPRLPESAITQRDMDLAASIQAVIEEAVLRLTRSLGKHVKTKNLCLAGGVALNCVANGKILRDGVFENVWIQPAAGDAGGAIGAALAAYHIYHGGERDVCADLDGMSGAFLGPTFEQFDIENRLKAVGAIFEVLNEDQLIAKTTDGLTNGKAVGWFQGRMEFGPRALGGRSILGDPRCPKMQQTLNLKVKYRESFRPFAPSVLIEDAADWFEINKPSPYMLFVTDIKKSRQKKMTAVETELFGIEKLNIARSDIPAVTHVDYSARVQTVHSETNPRYHKLLRAFKNKTECPALINTSFNIRGEPIVCTPEDAFRCFMGSEIDVLAIGNCFLEKEKQDYSLKKDYKDALQLD